MNRFQQRAALVPRTITWLIVSPLIALRRYWWVTYSGLYTAARRVAAALVSPVLPDVHRHHHDHPLPDPGDRRDPDHRRPARGERSPAEAAAPDRELRRAPRAQQRLAPEPAAAPDRPRRDGDAGGGRRLLHRASACSPAIGCRSTSAPSSAASRRAGAGPRSPGGWWPTTSSASRSADRAAPTSTFPSCHPSGGPASRSACT